MILGAEMEYELLNNQFNSRCKLYIIYIIYKLYICDVYILGGTKGLDVDLAKSIQVFFKDIRSVQTSIQQMKDIGRCRFNHSSID